MSRVKTHLIFNLIFIFLCVCKEQLKRDQLEKMLDTFVHDLPKLPDELNVNDYDSTLLEIEPDWNKFVGESYSQVIIIEMQIMKEYEINFENLTT